MSFQLSLPASLPSPDTPHTLASLSLGAPGTLTVEVLNREQRVALAQRAHCRLGSSRETSAATRHAVALTLTPSLTFTA
ncbi:hypothetical protein [Ramlibacter algicola]|uniref:Uncharacterized protein n=1 Tax=Ramlibacter algicola TaxID=2795217 RepID=A0A934UPK7_9BURK|nr:hypothetical protein [Ramlibacter algicola]MBK0391659.1 hypothetical protein [Ramlibacter algicola]